MIKPSIPPTLFVTRKWPPAVGGMETWAYRLAGELSRLGPVRVVALPGRTDGRPPSVIKLLLFPLHVFVSFLAMHPRPAIVHIGDMALWPIGWCLGMRRHVVISAHGTDVAYPRRRGLKGALYGAYLRLGARVLPGAHVIANSRATAAAAEESGWNVGAIVPLATDMSATPTESHGRDILFAGRLIRQKGLSWFVREVMPLLPDDMRLKVAGTAWDPAEAAALQNPRVDFLGPLDEPSLSRAFASSLCVVVPNVELPSGEFEGFGLVACEAAACGGVVLAARTGGLTEAVRDGETGVLMPSGEPEAWATAIRQVASWSNDERARFTKQAQAAARKHYAWSRVARDTATVYSSAA